ncbi:MAG TPA: hypothetical protein VKU94_06035 [Geobacterales bacterium]|nr:hypothetical protein [Geobacterales bacterium]
MMNTTYFWIGDKLLVKGEDNLVRCPFEVLMVVLAVGTEPGEGTRQASKFFNVKLNQYVFFAP